MADLEPRSRRTRTQNILSKSLLKDQQQTDNLMIVHYEEVIGAHLNTRLTASLSLCHTYFETQQRVDRNQLKLKTNRFVMLEPVQ